MLQVAGSEELRRVRCLFLGNRPAWRGVPLPDRNYKGQVIGLQEVRYQIGKTYKSFRFAMFYSLITFL
jgi:hypothetical protein